MSVNTFTSSRWIIPLLAGVSILCSEGGARLWAQGAQPVALIDLKPAAAEYGLQTNEDLGRSGPGEFAFEWGDAFVLNLSNGVRFWPENVKVVRRIDPEKRVLEYRSWLHDVFAVKGEFATGVGLWGRQRHMYHWVRYDIPRGARRFTATLWASDDPGGYAWRNGADSRPKNQQFTFSVHLGPRQDRSERPDSADPADQQVLLREFTRTELGQGSGEKLADLDLPLSPEAQGLRFKLQLSGWGDGNNNVELLLRDGVFKFE